MLKEIRRPASPQAAKSLLLLSAIAGGGAMFTLAAAFATAADPAAFDQGVLIGLRQSDDLATPIGPHWLLVTARDVTALGGTPVLTLLTITLAAYFAVKREALSLGVLLAAVLGQTLIVSTLKSLFDRPRPDIVPHLVEATNASFPSGHSASAAAIYLTLAALIARRTETSAARRFVFGAAVTLALMVGASRVFLGVHYPTDVLGGLSFGAAWAALVWYAARRIENAA